MAVDRVSFSVKPGESVGIIGGNGAGKSTVLKLLTRVSRPTDGRITVSGHISSLLEVGAGFHPDLNGRENIYLSGAILGMSRKKVQERMDSMVEFSGLADFLERPVRTYSSGMLLRLAFSVGIHLDSDILVIDEAIAVGDVAFQAHCMEKIHEFRRNGGTLVLVSHVGGHLMEVCERGLVMEKGRLVYDGAIKDALDTYMQGLVR
ncbi:ABC transporter ATP-binding protein [Enterobacter sp. WCHEn045836]|uniref:ABC transporter ATP-binding protein n=1 Tax=Enterobacter sp. WCHEn045836 TaxID=2497434 RepID=UPI0021ADCA47|nr:ABC transporter ATP-binding protein [Enterobacter sp. WCHEn045836]